MKNHDGDKRQFYHLSKAWYAAANLTNPDILDEITIGFFSPDGGTSGEFVIRWRKLGDSFAARLEAFDDSWDALSNFKDLIDKLAELDETNPTPDEIAALLVECGIEDATPLTQ